ncbi:uncharacterized protein [Parasteatoda tepidariorum]|uniref:uncharacterized protein isoform X2 n=1 Tax=Parasteatoda tepidariorum TaxID=114398 RepID=UPI001C729CED|nr:uncharacterized protein LOC107453308 isoform X2 [Parasteatoda tepidariorum]
MNIDNGQNNYVNNEILSVLPDTTSDIFSLPNGTHDTSLAESPNHKRILSVRFSNRSLLKIPLQDSNVSSLICFPSSDQDYKNVYTLSHITCRTMGFMTFASIRAKMSPLNRARINPRDLDCSGLERGASTSCKPFRTTTENCRMVTEVTCGACNGTSKGFKGVIKSPGFPFASFDDVTCEWNVMVPEHHSIILSFNQFDAIDTESADLPCGLHRPSVQIMFGIQSKVTIHRYCQLSELKNLSIPFHTVKIIVFTGLQGRRLSKNELGISISFEASVPAKESDDSPLTLLAFFLLGVIFLSCVILCHFIQKHKLCECGMKDRDRRILRHPMEHAYDLHNYNRTRIGNENLSNCPKVECAKAVVELQQNPKVVYESRKDFHEYTSLLDTSAGYIPSVTRGYSDQEKLNASLHKKLNLSHSYHGKEDPNRLSVSPPTPYYDYPRFNASSESSMEEEKKKLKLSKSTC